MTIMDDMQAKILFPTRAEQCRPLAQWLTLTALVTLVVFVAANAPTQAETGKTRFEGDFVQGGLVYGYTAADAKVRLDDLAIRVADNGLFLLGFNRNAPPRSTINVTYSDGQTETFDFAVKQREYDVQRIDGIPKKKVTPPPETLSRIRAETALVVQARLRDDDRQEFKSGFIWPAPGVITGVYGSQRVFNGKPRRPHYGVDVAAPEGTPIGAPAGGIVTMVHEDMYFSGGTLIVDHGMGLSSAFLHLSKIVVTEGQVIKQGEIIGEVGSTGRSTGPHYDWRVNLFKRRLDVQLLAPAMPSQ